MPTPSAFAAETPAVNAMVSLALDLRDLPPPEPLQRALEALAASLPGQQVIIRTRFRPAHLIDQLIARNCAYEVVPLGSAGWQTVMLRRV